MAIVDVRSDPGWIHITVVDVASLVDPRQKTVAPKLWTNDGFSRTQHDKPRQILVLGSKAITQPRTHAWAGGLSDARIHHEQRWFVIRDVCVHGPDDTDVVNTLSNLGINLAYGQP